MRRFLLPACALALVAACSSRTALPSDQVLEKAMLAAQELQSAVFQGTLAMKQGSESNSSEIDASFSGRTQDAGHALSLSIEADIETMRGDSSSQLHVAGDLTVLNGNETYLQLQSISGDDPAFASPLFAGMLHQWWQLPSTGTGNTASSDPRLLRMQTSILTVTRDAGFDEIGDREAYHYEVTPDPAKLAAFLNEVAAQRGEPSQAEAWTQMLGEHEAQGEVWIDADTFNVSRITWDIRSKETAEPMALLLDLTLTDHGAAEPISPPSDAKPFPSNLQQLLQAIPLPAGAMGSPAATELPPEVQEEILRSVLESR